MDYQLVRAALKDLRFEKNMSVPEVAEEAGVAKTTIYRLENLDDNPHRAIDLPTIEKLAAAMDLRLSQFFARIEGLNSTEAASTNRSSPNPNEHGSGSVPSPAAPLPLDDIGAVIAANSSAIAQLSRTLNRLGAELRITREQTPAARAPKTTRHGRG